ncbi:MAG: DUF1622 domain-containing protein [Syntrophotaleaceae bacterium]
MYEYLKPFAEWAGAVVEAIGIFLISAAAFHALIIVMVRLAQKQKIETAFRDVRQNLGRGILLGLEFLVASDIIHTVAVDLTFRTIGVLVTIVLIRTFLSFTLEVELTGNWPWQHEK